MYFFSLDEYSRRSRFDVAVFARNAVSFHFRSRYSERRPRTFLALTSFCTVAALYFNMTLSPANVNDYETLLDPTPQKVHFVPSRADVLSQEHVDGVYDDCAPVDALLPKILNLKRAVIRVSSDEVQVMWCASLCVVSVFGAHESVIAVATASPTTLPRIRTRGARKVSVVKKPRAHCPLVTDLHECALEVLDPGLSLWYGTLSHNQSIAFLQDDETGEFMCIHPRCKRVCKSLEEWRNHYSMRFPQCSVFKKATFTNGKAGYLSDAKLARLGNRSVKVVYPMTYRSLLDPRTGHEQRQKLQKMLLCLQDRQ